MTPARQWAIDALQALTKEASTPGERVIYDGRLEDLRQRDLILVIRDFHCDNYFSITKHGTRTPAQETVYAILSAALAAEAKAAP